MMRSLTSDETNAVAGGKGRPAVTPVASTKTTLPSQASNGISKATAASGKRR